MRLGVNIKEQWSKKERGAGGGGEDEGNYKKEKRGMEMESKPGEEEEIGKTQTKKIRISGKAIKR